MNTITDARKNLRAAIAFVVFVILIIGGISNMRSSSTSPTVSRVETQVHDLGPNYRVCEREVIELMSRGQLEKSRVGTWMVDCINR
jgi:hypothetical protein